MGRASAPPGLRITHVVGTGQFAGLERYVVEVSNALAAHGHDVHVVGGSPDRMPELVAPEVTWWPGATPKEALRTLVRAGRRDVVHSHISKADFVALAAAPVTGGRRVSTRHITDRRGYGRVAGTLAPLVHRLLAGEIVISHWLLDQIETSADVVIANGVRPAPDHADDEREHLVLMAQRLAPEKDTDVGLEAFAASGIADRGWRLVVAGDGPERPALERRAAELGLGATVEFTGWVADVEPLYARAGLLLAPAPTEPFGLTVLEAMSHGLPVVATGTAGHLETVGRLTAARLFEPRDATTAGRLLAELVADEGGRTAYAHALRELQRTELDLEVHVGALEDYYRSLLGRRARTGALSAAR